MNKAQLIDELATRYDGNRRDASHALESVLDVIQRALVKREKVTITGFGSFEAVPRAARTARNPRTGETVRVKKTTVPKFKAGAELKAVVSGEKKLPKPAAGAKKAAAKLTAKSTAKKSTAKSTAKKTTAKSTAKKSSAKKATTKKTTTKKVAAKSTAKKSTAKKATAKKSTAKKTTTKKAPARKTAAKKTARKR